jgi:SAM-dependent methyltransferase
MGFLSFRNLRFGGRAHNGDSGQEDSSTSPYSAELLDLLSSKFGLERMQLCADFGPGSGRLAQLFLNHGYTLVAHASAAANCPSTPRRHSYARTLNDPQALETMWTPFQDASGSATTGHLPDHSVDFVISERALYAPDRNAAQQELRRILKRNGIVALITDNRVYGGGTQTEEYDDLLRRHCRDFKERKVPADIGALVQTFFGHSDFYQDAFLGSQSLTFAELAAQTAKLSIYPKAGDPACAALETDLKRFFRKWAVAGVLRVPVVCRVACGTLSAASEPGLHAHEPHLVNAGH